MFSIFKECFKKQKDLKSIFRTYKTRAADGSPLLLFKAEPALPRCPPDKYTAGTQWRFPCCLSSRQSTEQVLCLHSSSIR